MKMVGRKEENKMLALSALDEAQFGAPLPTKC